MATQSKTAVKKDAKDVGIADIGEALAAVSRLMAALGEQPAFASSELGVTEWLFLRALKEDPMLRGGAIAQRLGVTAQRSTQIVTGLRKAGLISVAQSAEDSRKKDLGITDKGKTRLAAIDQAVVKAFATAIKSRPLAVIVVKNFARNVAKEISGKNTPGGK